MPNFRWNPAANKELCSARRVLCWITTLPVVSLSILPKYFPKYNQSLELRSDQPQGEKSVMFSRQITAVSIAALLFTTTAMAQPAKTLELGIFGDYTSFGDVVALNSGIGGGGRLGFFLLPGLELEAAASYSTTEDVFGLVGDVKFVPLRARLIYNTRLFGGASLLFGAGYVRNQFGVGDTWSGESGVSGLLGLRLNFSNRIALRIDGTADYLPGLSDIAASASDNTNLGLEAGFSIMFGNSRSSYDDNWDDVAPQSFEDPEPQPEPMSAAVDSDFDGVLDDADSCPGTSAGTAVDGFGCAVVVMPDAEARADGDGDGVFDDMDRCADTPFGESVDTEGCVLPPRVDVPVPEAVDMCAACASLLGDGSDAVILDGVTFAAGKWELPPASQLALDAVVRMLRSNPSVRLEITGYTDSSGSQRKNVWLSHTRAEAVKLYFTQRGIERKRLVTRGLGPVNPVASNDSAEGRLRNRRIEVKRLDVQ